MAVAAAFIIGVATWYGPGFYDQPLYCGGTYQTAERPWIAVDSSLLEGNWRCGDEVVLLFKDGHQLRTTIRDTGPLFRHYIEDWGPDVPIVADIAGENGKKSALCRLVNVSYQRRLWRMGGQPR